MLKILKQMLILISVILISIVGLGLYNAQSYNDYGIQGLETWVKTIENEGFVDLIGRLNYDHQSREIKSAKLKAYVLNNQDLFKQVYSGQGERIDLPYIYPSEIESTKLALNKYNFGKKAKFAKTNNMVKLRLNSKDELNQLLSENVLYDLVQARVYDITTGASASDVDSLSAWNRDSTDVSFPDLGASQKGQDQIIAILDTGVESDHPYLFNKVKFEGCFQDNTDDEDCINGDSGINSGIPCPGEYVGCFHGTMMAGIAAGNGDKIKIPHNGIAKDAGMYSIQVFSQLKDGECGKGNKCAKTSAFLYSQALDMVHIYNIYRKLIELNILSGPQLPKMGAVNMSFGSSIYTNTCDGDKELLDAQADIWELRNTYDVPSVISAGNGIMGFGINGVGYPACLSDAFTVSATNNGPAPLITLTPFSNAINGLTDISAPGDLTFSSMLKGTYTGPNGNGGGTSGAAAHVSGSFTILNNVFDTNFVKVNDRFKVLNDVATPFNYGNFLTVISIPPIPAFGSGIVNGNSRRLKLCKDYERVGVGDSGADAPISQGTWQCKGAPVFEPPSKPSDPIIPKDWLDSFRIKCEYCPKLKSYTKR
ncbi:MAG: S8 family peptidase [Patescibacteria group bacterium]